jgi:branched-chain amino acid aminotransferase
MPLASLDGRISSPAEATIPVTDEGLLRGDGVFEVVRLYGGRPFAYDDHLRRMTRSAANLRLEIDLGGLRADVRALLAAAGPEDLDGALRLVATRGGRRIALLEPLPERRESLALATVVFAPVRVLDGVKSLSYAANMLATRLAREQGGDEALLVTPHGRVLEAPTSSIFWATGGGLRTPPLSDHVLDSITRRRLLELVEAREEETSLEALLGADEAFLASTTREVQAVHAVDGQALGAVPGPLTTAAAAAFRSVVEAECAS